MGERLLFLEVRCSFQLCNPWKVLMYGSVVAMKDDKYVLSRRATMRKRDYLIFFILFFILNLINFLGTLGMQDILAIVVVALIEAAIAGTITNLFTRIFFKKS